MASLSDFLKVTNGATTEELREFNKILKQKLVVSFRVGDRVQFDGGCHGIVEGGITKINQKTISVYADSGVRWTVAPSLLAKI